MLGNILEVSLGIIDGWPGFGAFLAAWSSSGKMAVQVLHVPKGLIIYYPKAALQLLAPACHVPNYWVSGPSTA